MDVFKVLLENGADINAKNDANRWTVLHFATLIGKSTNATIRYDIIFDFSVQVIWNLLSYSLNMVPIQIFVMKR